MDNQKTTKVNITSSPSTGYLLSIEILFCQIDVLCLLYLEQAAFISLPCWEAGRVIRFEFVFIALYPYIFAIITFFSTVWVATSFTQWFEHSYATCRHSRQPPNSIPAIGANLHSLPRVSSVCTGWSCLGMEWAAKIRLRATRVVAESPVDHIVMYYWFWRATRIRGKGWGVLLRAALIGATLGLLGIIVRQKIEVCCLPRTNTGYHGSPFRHAIHSPGIFLADLWVRAQPVSSCLFIEASLRGFSAAISSLLGSI